MGRRQPSRHSTHTLLLSVLSAAMLTWSEAFMPLSTALAAAVGGGRRSLLAAVPSGRPAFSAAAGSADSWQPFQRQKPPPRAARGVSMRGAVASAFNSFANRGRGAFQLRGSTPGAGSGWSASARGARWSSTGAGRGRGGARAGRMPALRAKKKDATDAAGGPKDGYTLVVVESPAKARTIQKFLESMGGSFVVDSCMGHVRDLPRKAREIPAELKARFGKLLGVDADNGFKPLYVTMEGKEEVVKRLKAKQKGCKELILATDEDREGEAISWHLLELLQPKVPVKRAVFHEITKEAIKRAFESPRALDLNLVHAQETRRILDRLAGYTMSPLLWRKISPGLSAGRVQSVGLALIVRRERLRLAFVSAEYFDLRALLFAPQASASRGDSQAFSATLVEAFGKRVASGRDFDSQGNLTGGGTGPAALRPGYDDTEEETDTLSHSAAPAADGRKVVRIDEAMAAGLAMELRKAGTEWKVAKIDKRKQNRKPPVPFITSTLQQEANRKLGMSSKETMRNAQGLYEQGFITYMRTDNPVLSASAIKISRECVAQLYGPEHLPPADAAARAVKKPKGSQEAHEPIRPALAEDAAAAGGAQMFRAPGETGLSGRPFALYELIFQRTLASVMVDAELDLTTASIRAKPPGGATEPAVFRASGKIIRKYGWMRAYQLGSDAADAAAQALPPLEEKQLLGCRQVTPEGHTTKAPARYTEASFIKELEALGIGRPSTYAQILETLKDRDYVMLDGKALCPSLTAFVVIGLLEDRFKDFVDTAFTARMEERLDEIARGSADKESYLAEYYLGQGGLRSLVETQEAMIDSDSARRARLPFLDSPVTNPGNITVFVGPYGPYAIKPVKGMESLKAKLPPGMCTDVTKLSVEKLEACIEAKQGEFNGTLLGNHPDDAEPVLLKFGPFGTYVQKGIDGAEGEPKPKRVSIPEGEELSIRFEDALLYLALPRVVCQHPELGGDIKAGLSKNGPFVLHANGYRSLGPGDHVLTISPERAIELVDKVKARVASSNTLAILGAHSGKNVSVVDGRFGPYIKHGSTNARLPLMYRDMPHECPLDEAIEAVKEKEKEGPKGRFGRAKAGSKTKAKPAAKATAGSKTAKSSKSAKPAASGVVAKKRAKTSFLFFCQEKRAAVAATGLAFGDIQKELSVQWKGLDEGGRAPYEEMSSLEKLRYSEEWSAESESDAPPSPPATARVAAPVKRASPVRAKKAVKKAGAAKKGTAAKRGGAAAAAGVEVKKRPKSAYLFFCGAKRPEVAAQGLSFGDITKTLSGMWKEVSPGEKAEFEALAREDSARYHGSDPPSGGS